MNGCLILLIFLPFLMAVAASFVGEKRQSLRQGLVIFSCFVSFVLSFLSRLIWDLCPFAMTGTSFLIYIN